MITALRGRTGFNLRKVMDITHISNEAAVIQGLYLASGLPKGIVWSCVHRTLMNESELHKLE